MPEREIRAGGRSETERQRDERDQHVQSSPRGRRVPPCRPRPSRPGRSRGPEIVGEASATTCAATSSGCATLRSAIVREMRRTCSGVDEARGSSATPSSPARRRSRGSGRSGARPRSSATAAGRRGSPTWRRRSRRGRPRRSARRSSRRGRASPRGRRVAARKPRAVRNVAVRFASSVSRQRSSDELPHRDVARGPDPGDRRAHVERRRPRRRAARRRPRRSGRRLRPARRRRALGPLAAAVVVDDHLGALGGEKPHAGAADAARAAGDEDALSCQSGLHDSAHVSEMKEFRFASVNPCVESAPVRG